jgi:hypothetical protein
MFGEDHELPAPKFYTKTKFPTYADILTSHQDLVDCVKGAGGIAFIQNKTQSTERHSIRVIPGKATSGMTAYTWELLMQLIGLHLTRQFKPSLQGCSDCTSASVQIKNTISLHNDKLYTKNAGLLISAAHQMANIRNSRKILWPQEHSEQRPKKNKKPTED